MNDKYNKSPEEMKIDDYFDMLKCTRVKEFEKAKTRRLKYFKEYLNNLH